VNEAPNSGVRSKSLTNVLEAASSIGQPAGRAIRGTSAKDMGYELGNIKMFWRPSIADKFSNFNSLAFPVW
jgi:hypothetical protein